MADLLQFMRFLAWHWGKPFSRSRIVGKIRAAIIGVGNCASALVQGVQKYREISHNDSVPGIMHPQIGDFEIGDIEFVAAFDIDVNKVGKDLSEAILAPPNNTLNDPRQHR